MSTVKTDKIEGSIMPLPMVEGIGDLQTFIPTSGQVTYTLASFDQTMQLRIFVNDEEATWSWSSVNTVTISSHTPTTTDRVRVYKVVGEMGYKTASEFNKLVKKTSDTGAALIPSGTTAERPTSPVNGMMRNNSQTGKPEVYNNNVWSGLGGATGGGSDDVFYENSKTITTNYTISSNKNAMTAGPVTLNDGVSVTVPDGSTWTVV